MFRKLIVLLIVLGGAAAFAPKPIMRAQEHAPTVDVCRADRAVWDDTEQEIDYMKQETKHINDGVRNTNPIVKLPVKELSLRIEEMIDCMSVDEANVVKYSEMESFYVGILGDRYRGFIVRHHLYDKFSSEDAAGLR